MCDRKTSRLTAFWITLLACPALSLRPLPAQTAVSRPSPGYRRAEAARFEFGGVVRRRIEANLREWLLVAPDANPGMTGMFRVRDRQPVPDLVPWAGEFVGKYLVSAIPMQRMVRSEALDQVVERTVREVIAAQDADGYVGPFRRQERLLGQWDLWGHYHLMLALLAYADEHDDAAAFEAACRAADLVCQTYLDTGRRIFDAGSHEMNMAVIHGLGRLYRRTQREPYLRMMREIEKDWERAGDYLRTGLTGVDFFRTPRPRWESLHDLQGLAELYWITGAHDYRTAMLQHWRSIQQLDRHNTGSFSTGEGAVGSPYRPGAIETCCTVAWMALTIDALMLTGDPTAADELEWSFFNAMLGAQHPSGRWWSYDTPMDGVRAASAHSIVFQARPGTPELNCCSVNGPRSLAMLAEWAVMLDDAGPVVNYYGPGRIEMPDVGGGRLTLVQETDYPAIGEVQLAVEPDRAVRFNLRLRIPHWSKTTVVLLNDEPVGQVQAGSYVALDRSWERGDAITLRFDMTPWYWNGDAEVAGQASIFRGPLLLAFDQHLNAMDTHEVPTVDLGAMELTPASTEDRFSPIVLFDVTTTNGKTMRLCDFATAGAHGTHYRSWLPAQGGRPAELYLRSPREGEAIAAGLVLFEWTAFRSAHPEAATFELLVAEEADFERPVLRTQGLREGRYVHAAGFIAGKRYFWKVIAHNINGAMENADGPRWFTIDAGKPNPHRPDCLILAEGPQAVVITASLDGTGEPQRGCLSAAIDAVPAADRHGRDGGAIEFNGRTSRLQFAVPEFPQEAYTVGAWVYVEEFSGKLYQQIFSAWAGGMDDPLRLSIMGEMVSARIEAGQLYATPGVKVERKRWTHVAAVKDGATLRLFINGEPMAETTAPARVLSATRAVAIGANPHFEGDEYLRGRVDDLTFHARAMTDEEVSRLSRVEAINPR